MKPSRDQFSVFSLALLGFILTASCIYQGHLFLRERVSFIAPVDLFSSKIRNFKTNSDLYDAVFIGTSLTYRNLNPQIIRAEFQIRQREFRSMNLGFPQLGSHEVLYLLDLVDQIPRDQRKRLKYVLFEPLIVPQLPPQNLLTDRVLETHSLKYGVDSIHLSFRSLGFSIPGFELAHLHIRATLARLTNTGLIARTIRRPSELTPQTRELIQINDGFLALDDQIGKTYQMRNEEFRTNVDAYLAEIRDFRRLGGEPGDVLMKRVEFLKEVSMKIKSMGFKPILFLPPCAGDYYELSILYDSLGDLLEVPVLDFYGPGGNRELYMPANRWDREHLNKQGATMLSRALAQKMISLVESDSP